MQNPPSNLSSFSSRETFHNLVFYLYLLTNGVFDFFEGDDGDAVTHPSISSKMGPVNTALLCSFKCSIDINELEHFKKKRTSSFAKLINVAFQLGRNRTVNKEELY